MFPILSFVTTLINTYSLLSSRLSRFLVDRSPSPGVLLQLALDALLTRWQQRQERSQRGGLAQGPAKGLTHICWAMCSSFHCLLLLQLMDRLILRDKWLGILLHKTRCLLIIWRYLFLPYSPCQGEQAVNCDIQNALKHLFKTCPRVYTYICIFIPCVSYFISSRCQFQGQHL